MSDSKHALSGTQLFLVHDTYDGADDQFDTLEEATEYAEQLVADYRDDASRLGWGGDGSIEVCQVIRRWSLVPVPGPDGEKCAWDGDEYADMVEQKLPQAEPPLLTLEMVEREAKEIEARAKRGDLGICDWVSVGAGMDRLLRRLRQQMGGNSK